MEKSFSQKSGLNYGNHTGVKYYECNIFWSMGKPLIPVHILHDIREFMLEKERRNVLDVVNLSAADQIFHLQTTHTRLHMRDAINVEHEDLVGMDDFPCGLDILKQIFSISRINPCFSNCFFKILPSKMPLSVSWLKY